MRTLGRIVVMGVAGSGKSTIAAALAAHWDIPYIEADSLHSEANVAKMAAGVPLTDADRWPWLAAVRQAMRAEPEAVIACSALKRSYRDSLRAAGNVRFLDLVVDRDEVVRRVEGRPAHFMHAAMVDSQFEALEPPGPEETDIAPVDASGESASVIDRAEAALAVLRPGTATSRCAASVAPSGRSRATSCERSSTSSRPPSYSPRRRVLLVPPDLTRLHSRAGEITGLLFERLSAAGCEVAVLPALGTHAAMTPREAKLLFGDRVPFDRILEHRWREGLGAGRRDRRRRDRGPLGGTDGGADSGRGGRAAAGRLGSRGVDRPGRAPRGDRDGELHEEPRHRPRRRSHDPPQPLSRRGLRHGDDHGLRAQARCATWSTRRSTDSLRPRSRCSGC